MVPVDFDVKNGDFHAKNGKNLKRATLTTFFTHTFFFFFFWTGGTKTGFFFHVGTKKKKFGYGRAVQKKSFEIVRNRTIRTIWYFLG